MYDDVLRFLRDSITDIKRIDINSTGFTDVSMRFNNGILSSRLVLVSDSTITTHEGKSHWFFNIAELSSKKFISIYLMEDSILIRNNDSLLNDDSKILLQYTESEEILFQLQISHPELKYLTFDIYKELVDLAKYYDWNR